VSLPARYYIDPPSRRRRFWDVTNGQDGELSERGQQGISSRGYVPGPYSDREELLHARDAFVLERTRET
jgi:phenylpropionate dioxygenase-like ring-hydroxylating dioxygenase large terminal subunit